MASSPNYASVPQAPDIIQIATANTSITGSGTTGPASTNQLVPLTTGTANGVVYEEVRVVAAGTTTSGMVRFFLSNDGGTTKRLIAEVLVNAITPSSTTQAFNAKVDQLTGLTLCGTNTILYAATNNGETFNVFAHKAGM